MRFTKNCNSLHIIASAFHIDDCWACETVFLWMRSALCSGVACSVVVTFLLGIRMCIMRRLSSGWISSSCRLHSQSLASCSTRFRSTQLIRQDMGIQNSREMKITVPTTLSFRNFRIEVILMSLKISMILTIGSGLDFSHWPWWQNPWKHGVPSGRISIGLTALHELLRFLRQQRLHASVMLSHIQDCSPCVSQNGIHFPSRHFPFSMQLVSSGMWSDLGHSAELPVHDASFSHVA